MGESTDSSSSFNPSKFVTGEVRRIKEYWGERFAFLENYTNIFFVPEKRLPKWSDSDVEEFIASDPIHGPALKSARKATEIAATGSVIGAVSTAGLAWKYSKSPHGAALAFGAGAIFGWTFGQEIASHWLQLYRMDTMAAQIEFLDWWKNKSGGNRTL
ncbi:succinate dehydrogenase subunit 6, mitochondrial [Magnolia sinica]|uniref:succinate dehydrogenase subunit 6, mitochondrial n=1 Tax=Magnolia sinica TaxID=86752 RepID=UPI0026587113|nr:succinate dehydrogenase subunit 6, mitochondrial [Magnolia sinica]